MRAQLGRDLGLVDEQIGGAVCMGDDERERHRRAIDVAAADVEQPGDRIRRRQEGRVRLVVNTPTPRSGAIRDAAEIRHTAIAEGVPCLTAIETAIADLRGVIEGEDAEAIKEKTNALAEVSMKLGEAMYKASQAEAEAKAAGDAKPAEDDVVDADFEEVKDDKKSA